MQSTSVSHCVCQTFPSHKRQRETSAFMALGPSIEAVGQVLWLQSSLQVYTHAGYAGPAHWLALGATENQPSMPSDDVIVVKGV